MSQGFFNLSEKIDNWINSNNSKNEKEVQNYGSK